MYNFFLLLLVSSVFGIASPSFAYTTTDDRPIIYCPQHIECTAERKLDSCKLSDNKYGIWSIGGAEGRVANGIYKLKSVDSLYQYDGYNGTDLNTVSSCNYSLIDNQGTEKIIHAYPIMNGGYHIIFDALLTKMSQWTVSGWNAKCLAHKILECPLTEVPEIMYLPSDYDKQVSFKYYDNSSQDNYAGRLLYNQLLYTCGATSLCKIDVAIGWQRVYAGSLTVDISKADFVKIVSLDTDPSSNCILKKKEPFNVIYCDPQNKQS